MTPYPYFDSEVHYIKLKICVQQERGKLSMTTNNKASKGNTSKNATAKTAKVVSKKGVVNTEGMDRVTFLASCLFGDLTNPASNVTKSYSPNNIKSILIGGKFIIVVYHINKKSGSNLGNKVKSITANNLEEYNKIDIFDYSSAVEVDSLKLIDRQTTTSILGVLDKSNAKYRTMSYLEDVIFLNDCDTTLFARDKQYFGELKARILNTYEKDKLRGIYVFDMSTRTALDMLRRGYSKLNVFTSVSDLLKDVPMANGTKILKEESSILLNKKDWYSRGSLANGVYAVEQPGEVVDDKVIGGGVLWRYARKIKEAISEKEKALAELKKEIAKFRVAYDAKKKTNHTLYTRIKGIKEVTDLMLDNAIVTARVRWLFPFKKGIYTPALCNYIKDMNIQVNGVTMPLIQAYIGINWNSLYKGLEKIGVDKDKEEYEDIKEFCDKLLDNGIDIRDMKKNTLSMVDSLNCITTMLIKIFNFTADMSYYSYMRYFMQGDNIKYSYIYVNKIDESVRMELGKIPYSQYTVTNINKYVSSDELKYTGRNGSESAFPHVFNTKEKLDDNNKEQVYKYVVMMLRQLYNSTDIDKKNFEFKLGEAGGKE